MKRKIFKKLMAYTLVGAMTISTPIVASAEEETSIADVYTSTDEGEGTGTLSGTATGTYKYEHELEEKGAQVVGLALDKDSLALEKNGEVNTGRLQARVLYNDYDPEDEEMVLAADAETKKIIDNYLKWEVVDGKGVVGLSYYEKADGEKDHGMVNVTAKTGGNATVKVFIDYNVNGECDAGEYSAQATVSVKEYANSIKLVNLEDKYYLRHKYDLNKSVVLDPATATDKVSFYITSTDAKDTKSVVISDAGIMTVKKMPAGKVTLHAVTEKGKTAEAEITFDAGVGANKVEANTKSVILDWIAPESRKADVYVTLKAKDPANDSKVTDTVEWSTKQTKVVSVTVDPEDDTKATITAVGVGTATVTAKATSGKKATIKVTVNSTPDSVKIEGADSTYTGKKLQLTAVPYAKDGKEIPVGKTKFKFTVNKNKNIKVTSKGLVSSANLLVNDSKQPIKEAEATINLKATFKGGSKTATPKKITVKQADIDDVTVVNATTKNDVIVAGQKNATDKNIFAGRGYQYVATALPDATLSEAISWASSNKKVGTVSDNGLFTALKGGTTKLTASYVNVTTDSKGRSKAKVEKKTITVKAVQKATSLTLNKNVFVVKAGTKSVSINVKKQLPSGSKDAILWKTVKASLNNNKTEVIEGSKNVAGTGKNNAKVVIPVSDLKAGTVVKVGAFADGGAVSYAYIYVVDNKASGVQLINKTSKAKITNKDLKDIAVGTTVPFTPQVKVNGKFVDTVEYTRENIAYAADPVTYSFSKAGIATIDNGSIKALKPGTTKLTVKTASGKKTTLTIKVK